MHGAWNYSTRDWRNNGIRKTTSANLREALAHPVICVFTTNFFFSRPTIAEWRLYRVRRSYLSETSGREVNLPPCFTAELLPMKTEWACESALLSESVNIASNPRRLLGRRDFSSRGCKRNCGSQVVLELGTAYTVRGEEYRYSSIILMAMLCPWLRGSTTSYGRGRELRFSSRSPWRNGHPKCLLPIPLHDFVTR